MPILSIARVNSRGEAFAERAYADLFLIVVIAFPILGVFFPWETYLSVPTADNPTGVVTEVSRATSVVLTVLAAIIVVLYARAPRIQAALYANWPLMLFIAWAFVSAAWAEVPGQSINRTGRMLIYSLYAIYAVESLDIRRLTRVLVWAILIGLVASLAVSIVSPGLSQARDVRGAWRGAYAVKNAFGAIAASGLLIGFFGPTRRAVGTPLCWLLVVGSAIALVATNAVAPVVAMIVASLVATYLGLFTTSSQTERVAALVALLIGTVLLYVLGSVLADNLELVGRDATFTGRTAVWAFSQLMIDMKPVLGWGHGSWSGPVFNGMVMPVLHWQAPNAHNTWLDFRIQLGLPGLLLGVLMWVVAAIRALRLTLVLQSKEHLLWIAFLIYWFVIANVETLMVDPALADSFWFALFLASLTKLCRTASRVSTRPLPRPRLSPVN